MAALPAASAAHVLSTTQSELSSNRRQGLSWSQSALTGRRVSRASGVASARHSVARRLPGTQAALKDIPKQFRQENLKEGLMENFKNVPSSLYGLNNTQMAMLMQEDNPVARMSSGVTEETISSACAYKNELGMWSAPGLNDPASRLSMSVSMYGGGRGTAGGRPKTSPPDLPSLLLDARICYLGMAIVPAVTELVVAELLWLDYDNPMKPIYLYINSPGTQNDKRESVGFETEAYAIADTINYVKSKVYTVNCGTAFGQAAMLLALGDKGHRATQPNACTKLYAPKVAQSSGAAIDMWIKAKELDANTEYFVELLAKGTGKSKEEIARDIQRPKYFRGQEAVDYGLCDKVIESRGVQMEKRNYDDLLAQSKAMRAKMGRNPQAAAVGGARP